MDRTIDKSATQQKQGLELIRNVLTTPQGLEVIWCTQGGKFVANATVRSISPHAMKAAIDDLMQVVEDELRRLMFAANEGARK